MTLVRNGMAYPLQRFLEAEIVISRFEMLRNVSLSVPLMGMLPWLVQ